MFMSFLSLSTLSFVDDFVQRLNSVECYVFSMLG